MIEEIPQLEVKMGGYLIFKNEIALKPSKLFEDVMERIFRRWNLSVSLYRFVRNLTFTVFHIFLA